MKNFAIALSWIFALPVHANEICSSILRQRNFELYIEAIAPHEMHPARIQSVVPDVEAHLINALESKNVGFRRGHLPLEMMFNMASVNFQVAVGAQNRKWLKFRDHHLIQLVNLLNETSTVKLQPADFIPTLERLESNSELEEALAVAPFVLEQQASIMRHFIMNLYHERSGSISFGPREMSLLREVFQYAHLHRGDRALQVETKSPSVLTALRAYLPGIEVVGLRTGFWSDAERDWALPRKVWLRTGQASNPLIWESLMRDRDRFRMIFALDAVGDQFRLDQLMAWLAPHGSIVILNDHDLPPPFTEAEAKEAGLQILSWGKDRALPLAVRKVLYGNKRTAVSGELRAYVVRWGDEDSDRRPAKLDMYQGSPKG